MAPPNITTLTSTGASAWQLADWYTLPQQFGFAVISSGGSSFSIQVALEDPTRQYPNPTSSTPTAFTILQGSTGPAAYITGFSSVAIAAYRLFLNTQSSAGAPVTLVGVQSGD